MLANWLSGSRGRLRGQEGPSWSRGCLKVRGGQGGTQRVPEGEGGV